MRVFTAPEQIQLCPNGNVSIFLAGTIEMGKSHNWQEKIIKELRVRGFRGNIFNPRRTGWDDSWKQEFENPQFFQQVSWELDALDKATKIIMYFDPESKSPICLLELGLYASSGKMIVCCPLGYWRRGNVQIVCNKYNIPLYEDLETLIEQII